MFTYSNSNDISKNTEEGKKKHKMEEKEFINDELEVHDINKKIKSINNHLDKDKNTENKKHNLDDTEKIKDEIEIHNKVKRIKCIMESCNEIVKGKYSILNNKCNSCFDKVYGITYNSKDTIDINKVKVNIKEKKDNLINKKENTCIKEIKKKETI